MMIFDMIIHTGQVTSIAIKRYKIGRSITLEPYFHSDPRIDEWVDQITQKIFTVCLLTGVDSEVEFQRGCQIVMKVTDLLQGISIFPLEYLEKGLKQLLELQLPDARVINNFPTFQDTMNKMLHEGMMRSIDAQNNENITLASSEKNTPDFIREEDTKQDGRENIADQANRLKHVLGNIFPNVSVCWNLNLSGQTFLAKVEDMLICLHNPEKP